MNRTRTLLVFALLFMGAALVACGGGGMSEAAGRGVVLGVDPAKAQVTLDHEEIPDMMKAMTMTFDVADPAALEGLKEGDRVDFQLRYEDGVYTVMAIAPR